MKKHLLILSAMVLFALVSCSKDNKGTIDPKTAIDISIDETANCYLISEEGAYKFKATVKGNSTEPLDGTPVSAQVLWESFGTTTKPEVGSIVNNVAYSEGYVIFCTASSMQNGNAVIAVKDASDNILWSWHIWSCKGYKPSYTNQHVYNNDAGLYMDRNLGATSATPGDVHALGLLYQWGRKDPFLSGGQTSYTADYGQTPAASTITWPSPVQSTASTGTVDYVTKHPTTIVYCNLENDDWLFTDDWTRWQAQKTKYDPCPQGWHIPKGGYNGPWHQAFGYGEAWTKASNWDSVNFGMDFAKTDRTLGGGTVWYPAAGSLRNDNGTLYAVGSQGVYWSCTRLHPTSDSANALYYNNDGKIDPSNYRGRSNGSSVRCVAEE